MRTDPASNRSIPDKLPPILLASAPGNGSEYSRVSSAATVVRKLEEIHSSRLQVSVHLFDEGKPAGVYHSSLQKVDPHNRQVILHQLTPSSWRKLVTMRTPVSVSCYLPSGHVVFDTMITPLDDSPHNPFCVLDFPTSLHVQQLRTAFRVNLLPNTGSLELQLDSHLLRGKCVDISLSGCCGLFAPKLMELLQEVEAPENGWKLRMLYEQRELFIADAVVSRTSKDNSGVVIAGLHFIKPDIDRTRLLQPLLLELQRERIRQQPLLD